MASVSIAEAKDRLPELVRKVDAGERVTITRRGKPVAEIIAVKPPEQDRHALVEELRAELMAMTPSKIRSVDLIRAMRDEGP